MIPPSSHLPSTALHEINLGASTLFIMCDHSIDILHLEGEAVYLADNGIHLESDEVYKLFISLRDLFK